MASLLIIYGTMFAGIAFLVLQTELQRSKARKVAAVAPKVSRKHCRITYGAISGGKVTYYNEAGRKVTSHRTESSADLYRLIRQARAKGYRTI